MILGLAFSAWFLPPQTPSLVGGFDEDMRPLTKRQGNRSGLPLSGTEIPNPDRLGFEVEVCEAGKLEDRAWICDPACLGHHGLVFWKTGGAALISPYLWNEAPDN